MGWCSATDIMDAALGAAEAAVKEVIDGYVHGDADSEAIQARTDDALRPLVATIAEKLRDGDWDCIDESEYYHRFAQEMQGEDDREYEARLILGLHEAHWEDRPHWLDRLAKHREKMGRTDGAG